MQYCVQENDFGSNYPQNLHFYKFCEREMVLQQEMLAHPSEVLRFTHCETCYISSLAHKINHMHMNFLDFFFFLQVKNFLGRFSKKSNEISQGIFFQKKKKKRIEEEARLFC
ncbi:hypothetical protein SO802_031346 [Lithocarpus litseifolius]|uniref:Uncharacterized protein n=1 Tax=Lithocarpus litseifolius TaxID=425828 RepID=A0AAW2BNG6_9ROSI